jgi:hypothetical protein
MGSQEGVGGVTLDGIEHLQIRLAHAGVQWRYVH